MMIKRKFYKGEYYRLAEPIYRYKEEKRDGSIYVSLSDIVNDYRCWFCDCHAEYYEMLKKGYIDDEYAKENLYRCPTCNHINVITAYRPKDKRCENLVTNEGRIV